MNSVLISNERPLIKSRPTYNLYLLLKKYTDLKAIIAKENFSDNTVPFLNMDPLTYHQPYSPFLDDYFTLKNIIEIKDKIDLALLYAAPYALTVHHLKKLNPEIKIISDIAPHSIELSMEEHLRLVGNYPYPHLVDERLWTLYSEHLRLSDIVIVHSNVSAKYIKEKAKLEKMPVVIPHGCILPEKVVEPPDKFIVGSLNVAGIDKGFFYALQAWKKLNPLSIWYYVAGKGTEQWQNYVKKENIRNIKLIGWIPDVDEFYNKCSVFVFPSVTEGFGIPILEAMAHARPVIVAEGAGASELIVNGKEGFVTPIRDVDAIVEAIKYFATNKDEVIRMGKNARKKAERYSWEKVIEMYRPYLE